MKKILFLILIFSSFLNGQIKLNQLQPCKDSNGNRKDSCFIMTNSLGIQTYVDYDDLFSMFGNGGTLRANANGTYTYLKSATDSLRLGYTCTVSQDTVIRIYNYQNTLASTCTISGLYKAIKTVAMNTDTTLIFTNVGGQVFTVPMCPFVRNCQTTTTLAYNVSTNNLTFTNELGIPQTINLNESNIVNRTNGSYTHTNEKGDTLNFGYFLNCVNDSTIQLKDQDGTVVTTCTLKGGSGGGGAVNNVSINVDTVLQVDFVSGSSTTYDLCPVVRACQTNTTLVNLASGSYQYTSENGTLSILGYRFKTSEVPTNGKLFLIDYDGTKIDSVNICNPDCPAMTVIAVDDAVTATMCVSIYGNVKTNDTPCNIGISTYSYVENTAVGGYVYVDADGYFTYFFTDCTAGSTHEFGYRVCCQDGVCDYGNVIITMPTCGGGLANLDQYSMPRATSMSFDVGANDGTCSNPKLTTWTLKSPTKFGTIYLSTNGKGVYSPLPSYIGLDSAIINILCDGVICDTSFIKFKVIESKAVDDFYQLVAGGIITGNNVSTNDIACSAGITTYAWADSLYPPSTGNIIGTNPLNFAFYASPTFCGVAHRSYNQLCSGVITNTATAYFYVSCGNAIDDIINTADTTVVGDVAGNDNPCTNGGLTTWHLYTAPTSHGSGLTVQTYSCLIGGCPEATLVTTADAKITSWDTTTGQFVLDFDGSFVGEVCFKYVLKCKSGGTVNYDTACVHVIRQVQAFSSLLITQPDTNLPKFVFNLGGWCEYGTSGLRIKLNDGDKMKVTCVTAQGNVSVELIVGQNIKNAAGYTNDLSNRWRDWVVPSLEGNSIILGRNSLVNGTMAFNFRKDTFAIKSLNWGDGIVNVNKIGQAQLWNLSTYVSGCGTSTAAVDTVIKCFNTITTFHWDFSVNDSCSNLSAFAYAQYDLLGSWYKCPSPLACKNNLIATQVSGTSELECTSGTWTPSLGVACHPYNYGNLCYCLDQCNATANPGLPYSHRVVVNELSALSTNIDIQDTIYNKGFNGLCSSFRSSSITVYNGISSISTKGNLILTTAYLTETGGACNRNVLSEIVRVCPNTAPCNSASTSPIVFNQNVNENVFYTIPLGRYTNEGTYNIWAVGDVSNTSVNCENNVWFHIFSY